MKAYLAGPMRGYPDLNFPAFDDAKEKLERRGWTVVSPADLDRDNGFDPKMPVTNTHLRQFAIQDVTALCGCEAVVLLNGWSDSRGARAERAVGEWIGLPVFTIQEVLGV